MPQGHFVWYELMSPDPKAAAAFYGSVVGWSAQDSGLPGIEYTMFHMGGTRSAGLMALPEALRAEGVPPHWGCYIGVDDVDAAAASAAAAGATVHRGPADIPQVGRFAAITDPQGAHLALFQGNGEPPPPAPMMAPGSVGWHELHTTDWQAAFAFYAGQFGWTEAGAHEMGPMGTYKMFATGAHPVGGMFTDPRAGKPFWLAYFAVPEIHAAVARVTAAGGEVLHGPMEVPGGAWIINGRDPQGAHFALVAPPG